MYAEISKISDIMRGGCLVLLFKKRNMRNLKNYKLFMMLNVNYKIIAKIMANRLQEIKTKLIE